MRCFCLALCAILLFCADAHARNLKNLGEPMLLDAGDSKRMRVVFNHSSHKNVPCANCHHEGLPANRYAPCTSAGCHSITAPSSREPLSVYMAYHAQHTKRSCYGCHKTLAGKYPGFHGCSPCHQTPQGRKMKAEAKKAQVKAD